MNQITDYASDPSYHLTGIKHCEDWWRFEFMMGNGKYSNQNCDEYLEICKAPANTVVTRITGWVRPSDQAVSALALYQQGTKLIDVGNKEGTKKQDLK